MSHENYYIKKGYKCNPPYDISNNIYDDTIENADRYQIAVYKKAAAIIKNNNLKSCLDIGCGYGRKLVKYIYPVCPDITGIDEEHSINYCKTNNSVGKWTELDIEKSENLLNRKFDLIIAADVIEHLNNPDTLVKLIKNHTHSNTYIIISTPERDYRRGKNNFGPPQNKYHIREWNSAELIRNLRDRGFIIIDHILVDDTKRLFRNNLKLLIKDFSSFFKKSKFCQICVCKIGDEN